MDIVSWTFANTDYDQNKPVSLDKAAYRNKTDGAEALH